MKVALVGSALNPHMQRWVKGLSSCGIHVHVVTQDKVRHCPGADSLTVLPMKGPLGYYLNAGYLKKTLANICPDIVHAHYASGYGTLLRKSGFKPYILSVWGSDLLVFPKKSIFHYGLLKKNLYSASIICSTSRCMRTELIDNFGIQKEKICLTPFGIDTRKFAPVRLNRDYLTIGTVKTLERVYGIDRLLEVVAQVVRELRFEGQTHLSNKVRLSIVGRGKDYESLTIYAKKLGIYDIVSFKGYVEQEALPQVLNVMDIFCAFSRSESFGVAVLEASATGLPVVVTNVGGLPEVVRDGETGFIVEEWSKKAAVAALKKLLIQRELRERYGNAGRRFVLANYDCTESVNIMRGIYQSFLALQKGNE